MGVMGLRRGANLRETTENETSAMVLGKAEGSERGSLWAVVEVGIDRMEWIAVVNNENSGCTLFSRAVSGPSSAMLMICSL